ncbi:hypothetical protein CF336_g9232 [Tilletia laevis]|nr:hypothetical protein CF336_g9232 [Tilletia laevis]
MLFKASLLRASVPVGLSSLVPSDSAAPYCYPQALARAAHPSRPSCSRRRPRLCSSKSSSRLNIALLVFKASRPTRGPNLITTLSSSTQEVRSQRLVTAEHQTMKY